MRKKSLAVLLSFIAAVSACAITDPAAANPRKNPPDTVIVFPPSTCDTVTRGDTTYVVCADY